MRDGYSVAKVEWIADEPVVAEEEGKSGLVFHPNEQPS